MDGSFTGVIFVGLLFMSAFFSATETAFFALSPLRLKKQESEGDVSATEILGVLADKQRMLMTLLMGNTMTNVISTAMATNFLISYIPGTSFAKFLGSGTYIGIIVASFVMTVLLLVFGEITPKTIAIYGAYTYSRLTIKPLRFFIFIFYPITSFVIFLLKKIFPSYANWNQNLGSSTSMEEIDRFFTLGEEVGIIEGDEKDMISSVFEFGDTFVKEVMVPRPDIVSISINIGFDELLQFVKHDGNSRLPVYDNDLDKIVGILYVKDILMKFDSIKKSFDLFNLLRPAFFVPETKKLDNLLKEFQKRKQHLAMVVDEYGGIAGLVTIEDLLEEIVGEIVDEYDQDEQKQLIKIGEDLFNVDAGCSIKDLEEELDCRFDYEDSETVGGFVLEKLGRIPKKDEEFAEPQGIFRVLEIKGNRILRVSFKKH